MNIKIKNNITNEKYSINKAFVIIKAAIILIKGGKNEIFRRNKSNKR